MVRVGSRESSQVKPVDGRDTIQACTKLVHEDSYNGHISQYHILRMTEMLLLVYTMRGQQKSCNTKIILLKSP